MKCLICENNLEAMVSNYTFFCNDCDYWRSNLEPNIESKSLQNSEQNFTEDDPINIEHLDTVRKQNFAKIFKEIENRFDKDCINILDIGSGTGLFLEMGKKRGHSMLGIEPNQSMYSLSKARGVDVRRGYFPQALDTKQKFDVIILNDVFEHIEDLETLVFNIKKYMAPTSHLFINVPNSDGVIFKLALFLAKFNKLHLWDRMWQKMFYTPHLHYFSKRSLSELLAKNDLIPDTPKIKISAISLDGLWTRIRADKSQNLVSSIFYWSAVFITLPVIHCLQPDSFVITARLRFENAV